MYNYLVYFTYVYKRNYEMIKKKKARNKLCRRREQKRATNCNQVLLFWTLNLQKKMLLYGFIYVKHVVIYLCFKSAKSSSSFFLEGTYGILSNIIIQKNPHLGDFVCMCARKWSQGHKHIECVLHTSKLGSVQGKIVKAKEVSNPHPQRECLSSDHPNKPTGQQ